MSALYFPQIFDASDMPRAKEIILTNEGPGADTESRWAIETPYVLELLQSCLPLTEKSVVLDYGCGLGRIAHAMIAATGCSVIGLDISDSMRRMAVDYVASSRFCAVSPEQFDAMVSAGLRVDAAISIWVLQHCFAPGDDIDRVGRGLADGGRFFVLNMPKRAVPVVMDGNNPEAEFFWASDSVDVAALLRSRMVVLAEGEPDQSRVPNMADAGAYWMSLTKAEHPGA